MSPVKPHLFPSFEALRRRKKVLRWSTHMSLSKTNMETVRFFMYCNAM